MKRLRGVRPSTSLGVGMTNNVQERLAEVQRHLEELRVSL